MWCDNCCLLFPLRAGAIAWGLIIAILNIAGGIVLFKYGEFFFFSFNSEWNIMGALAMLVAALAFINIVALSNRSYIFTRVCNFAWPFVVILSAIRDILIIVELQRGKNDIISECQNGGLLFSGSPAQPPAGTISPDPPATLPSIFCSRGFSSLNTAFIVFIVIDLILQIYMTFLNWRFVKRMQHYTALPGPLYGGFYKAWKQEKRAISEVKAIKIHYTPLLISLFPPFPFLYLCLWFRYLSLLLSRPSNDHDPLTRRTVNIY